jgi:hypothetical protein
MDSSSIVGSKTLKSLGMPVLSEFGREAVRLGEGSGACFLL